MKKKLRFKINMKDNGLVDSNMETVLKNSLMVTFISVIIDLENSKDQVNMFGKTEVLTKEVF